jgi:hypothetical protein
MGLVLVRGGRGLGEMLEMTIKRFKDLKRWENDWILVDF